MDSKINKTKLSKFIVKAKIATYASGNARKEIILKDRCKELNFEDGGFKYRDRYFGSDSFSGEEVVWRDGKPIWSMNYFGRIKSGLILDKDIVEFLRKCMRMVKENRPFRGPEMYKEGDFQYVDESLGSIECFVGIEKIFCKAKEVYRLDYHGGLIK